MSVLHPFQALSAEPTADLRGMPTFMCPCGSDLFTIVAKFDPDTRLPGFYLLDGMCVACGSLATMPTPIDEGDDDGLL